MFNMGLIMSYFLVVLFSVDIDNMEWLDASPTYIKIIQEGFGCGNQML